MSSFQILDISTDDSTLVLTAHYPCSAEKLFKAWIDPKAMEEWIRPVESCTTKVLTFEPHEGGFFQVEMTIDSEVHRYSGTIRVFEPPHRLVMDWQWETTSDEPYDLTLVTVELEPELNGTRLTLTHAKMRSLESRHSHSGGWSGSLTSLLSYMEQA